MKGHLILIIGPSGSGKSSILKKIREQFPHITYAVSYTTRAPRPNEVEGEVYHFISEDTFRSLIEEGAFLEWASYGGNLYGTSKDDIVSALQEGKVVLREVEVQGARSIQKLIPKENLTIIFIDGGSWEELKERITARAPMAEAELALRRERYDEERLFLPNADVVISNREGELEKAIAQTAAEITALVNS